MKRDAWFRQANHWLLNPAVKTAATLAKPAFADWQRRWVAFEQWQIL